MVADPTVAVVIVTWRSEDVIGACLDSVLAALPAAEVIVVDNASADNTREIVRSFPTVRLLERPTNDGFARAMNDGVCHATAPVTIVLNPDALLTAVAVHRLLETLAAHDGDVVLGPRLVNEDGSVQRSAFRFPGPLVVLLEQLALGGRLRWLDPAGTGAPGEPEDPRAVDWLKGACLVGRTAVLRRFGPFDERFFMFGEDVDLGRRIALAGGASLYVPRARVVHAGGTSTRHVARRMTVELFASTFRLYGIHEPPVRLAVLASVVAWLAGLKGLLGLGRGFVAAARRRPAVARSNMEQVRAFAEVGRLAVRTVGRPDRISGGPR